MTGVEGLAPATRGFERAPTPRRVWLALGALTLIAFALRVYRLNHSSLWMDEVGTMAISDPALSWREFFQVSYRDPHPLGHYGFLKLWLTAFGYTEFQARLSSAVVGTLAIPATFLLARMFAGTRGGLFAALVAAVGHYFIFYSQEVRGYMLLYLAACGSYGFFFALCAKSTRWRAAGYTATTIVALHSHYFAGFMAASQAVAAFFFAFVQRGGGWRVVGRFVVPGILTVLSLVPMIGPAISGLGAPSFIKAAPPGHFPLTYFYLFFGENIVYSALAALPIGLVLFAKLQRWVTDAPAPSAPSGAISADTAATMIFVMLIVGLGLPYILSVFVQPILFIRYTTYTLPLYMMLIALGFAAVAAPWKRWAFAAAMTAISLHVLVFTKAQYSVTVKFDQPRELVRYVVDKNAELRTRDPRYLSNHPSLVQFYMRSYGIRAPLLHFTTYEEIPGKLGAVVRGDVFWVVVNGWDPNPAMLPFLAARYDRVVEARFQRGYAGLWRMR